MATVAAKAVVVVLATASAAETWRRVGQERLDLLTCALLVATVALCAVAAALLVCDDRRARLGAIVSIVTSGVLLFGAELVFRQRGTYATYLERNGGGSYQLQYHHTSRERYHVYTPRTSYTTPRPEFAYPRTTNEFGLPDREIPREKAANEYRLLALGDSYTEGVGTAAEATWLKVLEAHAAAAMPDRAVSSFNAGVSGSDPWYSLVLLQDKLLIAEPDVVLLAINASDVNDVIIRGGLERFQDDGTVRPRPAPRWEWLYGVSFLARHVIHDVLGYNSLFIKESRWQEARLAAGASLLDCLREFQKFTRDRGVRFVVVFHPDTREAGRQRYERAFAAFVADAKQLPNLQVVDVLERWIASHRLDDGRAASLYWPVDGHNTPEGYKAFGEAVADALFNPRSPVMTAAAR